MIECEDPNCDYEWVSVIVLSFDYASGQVFWVGATVTRRVVRASGPAQSRWPN